MYVVRFCGLEETDISYILLFLSHRLGLVLYDLLSLLNFMVTFGIPVSIGSASQHFTLRSFNSYKIALCYFIVRTKSKIVTTQQFNAQEPKYFFPEKKYS